MEPIKSLDLDKAYAELNVTVCDINRKIAFHNIKMVMKTYVVCLTAFTLGYFSICAFCSLLGITAGMFAAAPLVIMGSYVLKDYIKNKFNKENYNFNLKITEMFYKKTSSFDSKIQETFKECLVEKYHSTDWLKGYISGWFPNTIAKFKLKSFEVIKPKYDEMQKPCVS